MIDAGVTELFRPREIARSRGEDGPHSAVTKVLPFSDTDTVSSEVLECFECFELMSMTSDSSEFKVALLDLLGCIMIVCGAN